MRLSNDWQFNAIDLMLMAVSIILLVISIVLWYLAFLSGWLALVVIATVLLLLSFATLTLSFLLIVRSLQAQLKVSKVSTTAVNLGGVPTSQDSTRDIVVSNDQQAPIVSTVSNQTNDSGKRIVVVTLSAIEWRIINHLRRNRNVFQNDLVEGCNLSKSSVSSNLNALELKGIVKREKRGKRKIVYLIHDPQA